MNIDLENKVAVITGAGRGIGKSIAISYALNGARVCCLSRSQDEIDDTVSYIKSKNQSAIALVCDVSNYNELEKAFKNIYKTYGKVDIVVINAGVDCDKASVEELSIEAWERVMDINFTGAFYTAKAAIPYLKKQGGKIINYWFWTWT